MSSNRVTSIGRPFDPKYPTNRAILALTVVVTVVGGLVQLLRGMGLLEGGLWGIRAGLAVFLAWMVCREFDPDHDLSAFVAAGLALVGLLWWDPPNLGALLWLALVMRVVNRTPGLPATVVDALAVVGVGGWLAWQGNWGYGVVTVLALILDGLLPPRNRQAVAFVSLGVAAAAIVAVWQGKMWGPGGPSVRDGALALAMGIASVPVIVASNRVRSVDDETGEPLTPLRVQAAQVLAVLAGVQAAVWDGMAGLASMSSLWAAVLGAGMYWVWGAVGGRRGK
jgi:hypothetical protein